MYVCLFVVAFVFAFVFKFNFKCKYIYIYICAGPKKIRNDFGRVTPPQI